MNNKESLLANKYINFKIYNTYRQEVSDELTKLQVLYPLVVINTKMFDQIFLIIWIGLSNITRLTI